MPMVSFATCLRLLPFFLFAMSANSQEMSRLLGDIGKKANKKEVPPKEVHNLCKVWSKKQYRFEVGHKSPPDTANKCANQLGFGPARGLIVGLSRSHAIWRTSPFADRLSFPDSTGATASLPIVDSSHEGSFVVLDYSNIKGHVLLGLVSSSEFVEPNCDFRYGKEVPLKKTFDNKPNRFDDQECPTLLGLQKQMTWTQEQLLPGSALILGTTTKPFSAMTQVMPLPKVAIADSGVACTHGAFTDRPDAACEASVESDFVACSNTNATGKHGTHIAGTVAGGGDNDIRVGISNASLLSVRLATNNEQVTVDLASLAKSVYFAHLQKARIFNASWTIPFDSTAVRQAVLSAGPTGGGHGMLIIAAGGLNYLYDGYPADYSGTMQHVIGASAVSAFKADKIAILGPQNRYVDGFLTAPGHCIYSADYNGGYGFETGSSSAAAYISGATALILSDKRYSHCNAIELKKLLFCQASRYGLGPSKPNQTFPFLNLKFLSMPDRDDQCAVPCKNE